jgi:predicted neutral ceramidase superfamily lipid hydrolase
MVTFLRKHATILLISGLLTLLLLAWVFPASGLKLGIGFLLLSFLVASLAVLEKHQKAFRNGQLGRGSFIRNATLEVSGTFLVMLLAGLLGRYAAEVATQQIEQDLLRVVAGLAVGLAVGISVGVLAKRTLRRLVDVLPPS